MPTTSFDYLLSPIFVYKDLGTQLFAETVAELCSLKQVFLKTGRPLRIPVKGCIFSKDQVEDLQLC